MCSLMYDEKVYKVYESKPYFNFERWPYFDEEKYNIKYTPFSTTVFEIKDGFLCVKEFHFVSDNGAPIINRMKPLKTASYLNIHRYSYYGLHLKLDYTGSVIIIKKAVTDFTAFDGGVLKCGPSEPWEYKEVIEFAFENGAVTKINNQSEICLQIREKVLSDKELQYFILKTLRFPSDFTLDGVELPSWMLYTNYKLSQLPKRHKDSHF